MLYTVRKVSTHTRRATAEQLAEFLFRRANSDMEQYLKSLMDEMFDPLNAQAIQKLMKVIKKEEALDKSKDIINQDMDKREQFLNQIDSLKNVITHPVLSQDLDMIKDQIFNNQLTMREAEALLQAIHFKQTDFEDVQEGQTALRDKPVSIRPEQQVKPEPAAAPQSFQPLWSDEGGV